MNHPCQHGRLIRLPALLVVLAWIVFWGASGAVAEDVRPAAESDLGSPLLGPGMQSGSTPLPVTALRNRLIKLFDFEERKLGNYEDLPMHWFVMGRRPKTSDTAFLHKSLHETMVNRPGFPTYTTVIFDDRERYGGDLSLRMDLNGGNVGAFLEVGTLPATPGSDYMLTAMVRTTALKHALARVHLYFVDRMGRRIDHAEAVSSPLQTAGVWQSIRITLPGDAAEAAWLGISLELLQPVAKAADTLGGHEVVYQDIEGSAWFDDISVWQVPRVMVATQSPMNILRVPERPRIQATVQDMTGHALLADLRLIDCQGRVVDATRQRVGDGAPMNIFWNPKLPAYGWYVADLTLYDQKPGANAAGMERDSAQPLAVARDRCPFLWLPQEPALATEEAARFMIDVTGAEREKLAGLPQILEAIGAGGVILSCWEPTTTRAELDTRIAWLDALIEELLLRGRQVNLSLDPLPNELAGMVDAQAQGTLAWLAGPDNSWRAYLAPIMMRQGQHIQAWQVGGLSNPLAYKLADLSSAITNVQQDFRRISPQQRLLVPWVLDQSRRRDVAADATYHIMVPPALPVDRIPAYMAEWREPPAAKYNLILDSSPQVQADHFQWVRDISLRMIESWATGPRALVVRQPWSHAKVSHHARLLPHPALGVFSGMSHRLAGRRLVGELPVNADIRCLVFDGPAGGELAIWQVDPSKPATELDMFLGGAPVAVDVWGNRSTVALVNGRHRLPIGAWPTLVEGIDASLALFRTTFRISPAFIESSQTPHPCSLTISNPWKHVLTGSILFTEPENWRIEPRRFNFAISPGQSASFPVEVQLPVSETSGPKKIVARVEVSPDQQYRLDMVAPIEIGMRGLKFDAALTLERNPATGRMDAVVKQTIVNVGSAPVSLYCFASLPGFPRQERLLPRLEPGKPTVRRFRFADAQVFLEKNDLRVGIREVNGPAVLNKLLSTSARAPGSAAVSP